MRRLGDRCEVAVQGIGSRLDHLAAAFANEEDHEILRTMAMSAGEIGIARGKPMDEAVFEQEIERPIDRDRSRVLACRVRHFLDHVIGAEGAPLTGEDFEDQAAARRQFDAMMAAKIFGRGQRAFDGRARRGVLALTLFSLHGTRCRHGCNIA